MHLSTFLCVLSVTLLPIVALHGQIPNRDIASLKERFESPEAVQWMHTFKGSWQNIHPVEVTLAYDGLTYAGTLHLVSGDVFFELEGYAQDGQIRLQEIDQSGRTSGYLIVQISEGRMTGQWWSMDFARSASVLLRDESVVELRRFTSDLLVFKGSVDQTDIELIVQREESDLLAGFCLVTGEEPLYRLSGRCEDAVCDQMNFEMVSRDGETRNLRCTRQRGQSYRFQMSNETGVSHDGTGTMLNTYPMRRMDLAGYIGNIDCLYPELGIATFDNWVTSQVGSWFDEMKSYLDSLEEEFVLPGPAERWSVQASAWIDMTMITPEYLSGILTMYQPARNVYDRSAFIFDVRGGKLLEAESLGRKADFRNTLEADATHQREISSGDEVSGSWAEARPFQHIAITTTGFVLFTDYDPVLGDAWVTLKFDDYRDIMKRNAFVLDLMQK